MPVHGLLSSALAALATGVAAGVVAAQVPFGTVDVAVTVDAAGTVRIEERYLVTPAPPTFELRTLARPCAEVLDVRVERNGVEAALAEGRDGPWIVFGSASGTNPADTLRATVRYEVRTSAADVGVPLLYLTEPIPQRDGEREGTVRVVVRLPDAAGGVRFPHMAREGPGTWGARYVAIPSFVEIARPAGAEGTAPDCRSSPARGDDGGLTWRFLLLVGIMVAWVPTYLAWARRSSEGGA